MVAQYLHGIETVELSAGIQPVTTVKSSVIGLLGTAPNADPVAFPLNTPVAVFSNATLALSLGTAGTLLDAINAIYSQGAAFVIVVRVAYDPVPGQTWANLVGTVSAKTGVWSFLNARSILGVEPRIMIAPGHTAIMPSNGVSGFIVTAGGSGYDQTTTVSMPAPPAPGIQATAVAQIVGGAVTGVSIINPGTGYTSAPSVTINGPVGSSGAAVTAVSGKVANPVAVALQAYADRKRAFALVDGPGTNYADAYAYRNTLGSQRIMVIDPGVLSYSITTASYVNKPSSAYAAGLQSRIDNDSGFWFSFSNNVIQNIGGSSRPIDWGIDDSNSESNLLNSVQVTTIINDSGYRFWGLRGCGSDPLWSFMSVRRTADLIYDSLERAERSVMDKPFSTLLLKQIQSTVNSYLSHLVQLGALIGGKCWIDPNLNNAATFANGQLYVNFDLEPPAPLEHLIFQASRNPAYYNGFIETFNQQVTGS